MQFPNLKAFALLEFEKSILRISVEDAATYGDEDGVQTIIGAGLERIFRV
jgi:hypothetical protein